MDFLKKIIKLPKDKKAEEVGGSAPNRSILPEGQNHPHTRVARPEGPKRATPDAYDIIYEYLDGLDCDMMGKALYPLYKLEVNGEILVQCINGKYYNILKYLYNISKNNDNMYMWYPSLTINNAIILSGSIAIFEFMSKIWNDIGMAYDNFRIKSLRSNNLYAATKNNDLVMLDYLIRLNPEEASSQNLCQYAFSIDMLNYTINIGGIPTEVTFANAIERNNIEMIHWLLERNYTSYGLAVFTAAAKFNRFDILQLLYKYNTGIKSNKFWKNLDVKSTCITGWAAYHGNYEMFKWLQDTGCLINVDIFRNATIGGNIQILQYVYSSVGSSANTYCTKETALCAISSYLTDAKTAKVLAWYESIGIKNYTETDMNLVIQHNKPETMEYLYKLGTPLPLDAIEKAINYGSPQAAIKLIQLIGFDEKHRKNKNINNPKNIALLNFINQKK